MKNVVMQQGLRLKGQDQKKVFQQESQTTLRDEKSPMSKAGNNLNFKVQKKKERKRFQKLLLMKICMFPPSQRDLVNKNQAHQISR